MTAEPVYTNANLLFDKYKNRKWASIWPGLLFYGMLILVITVPLCKGMAWLPFQKVWETLFVRSNALKTRRFFLLFIWTDKSFIQKVHRANFFQFLFILRDWKTDVYDKIRALHFRDKIEEEEGSNGNRGISLGLIIGIVISNWWF